jgi:hypothetical protein
MFGELSSYPSSIFLSSNRFFYSQSIGEFHKKILGILHTFGFELETLNLLWQTVYKLQAGIRELLHYNLDSPHSRVSCFAHTSPNNDATFGAHTVCYNMKLD